jgi:hypothetical protein
MTACPQRSRGGQSGVTATLAATVHASAAVFCPNFHISPCKVLTTHRWVSSKLYFNAGERVFLLRNGSALRRSLPLPRRHSERGVASLHAPHDHLINTIHLNEIYATWREKTFNLAEPKKDRAMIPWNGLEYHRG